jgi:hypothetical protein
MHENGGEISAAMANDEEMNRSDFDIETVAGDSSEPSSTYTKIGTLAPSSTHPDVRISPDVWTAQQETYTLTCTHKGTEKSLSDSSLKGI